MEHANDIAVRTVCRRDLSRPGDGRGGEGKPEAMGMKKILVIDYDQNSLAYLSKILTSEGYQVDTAADGQAGWDRYVKDDPDLVLMEAMLPKVHGFELCQRITSERDSQTTVFIMTGVYKDRVYRTEALRTYGACEYFEKPLKMPEVLAAIEKAIGRSVPASAPRPEPRQETEPGNGGAPAAEPGYEFHYEPAAAAAKPARDDGPAPVPVAARRREKHPSDDDLFSLPADLDRLSREIPKARKPASPRREQPAEERFDALADELLKKIVAEPEPPKARIQPRPTGDNGNGNGNGSADIDQFLKSALAGFDVQSEKVKVPKTAPLPPPPPPPAPEKPRPVPPPPVAAKPRPAPPRLPDPPAPAPSIMERLAAEKPKPAPAPRPDAPPGAPVRDRAARPTLAPGDPGSDVSPFFMPEKPKPQAAPAPTEVKPQAPRPFPPAERAERRAEPARPEPARREPARQEPARDEAGPAWRDADKREPQRPEPLRHEPPKPEPRIIPGDIFQSIIEQAEPEKKGVSPWLAVVAGIVVVAAVVGFFVLKPKFVARNDRPANKPRPAVVREEPVAPPVEEAAAPEVKPETVEPKPAPKAKSKPKPAEPKPTEPEPSGVEAVIPVSTKTAVLPPASNTNSPARSGSQRSAAANPARTEQAPSAAPAPSSKEDAAQPQASATDSGAATSPSAEAPVVVPPPPADPPVAEGTLVDLATVTELPRQIKSVDPVYPQTAQRLGIEGTITVNALIDEKGNVIDTAIIKGVQDDKGLGRAAETAVKKWKFEPARKDGVAVKVWRPFAISFKAPK